MADLFLEDALNRVRLMASGSTTWDLSPNDLAALKSVLSQLDSMKKDRDEVLDALSLCIRLACMRRHPVEDGTQRCGECEICKMSAVVIPFVKWIERGWNPGFLEAKLFLDGGLR